MVDWKIKIKSIFFYTLPVILCLAVYYWFITSFEKVSYRKEVGYQGEARYNKLLFAERFLLNMQVNVDTLFNYSILLNHLETTDTLILYDHVFCNYQIQNLWDWVEQGGRLIFAVGHYSSCDKTLLLEKLGVHVHEQTTKNFDYNHAFDFSLTKKFVFPFIFSLSKMETNIPWHEEILTIEIEDDYHFRFETRQPLFILKNQYGIYGLGFKIENGHIILLTDLEFITNNSLPKHQHALFLWRLVTYPQKPNQVWLFLDSYKSFPSLLQFLWQHAWFVFISGAILLIFWLWHRGQRFGSILPSSFPQRRSLLEHIDASGYFMWQHQLGGILLKNIQQSILVHIQLFHPQWSQLTATELSEQLVQLTDLSSEKIERALFDSPSETRNPSETEFTETMRILIKIRQVL